MSEHFNPYAEWLGVPGGRRPVHYYELLGLRLFEEDPAAIARAADVLIARIRRVRPGPRVAEWQQLLDELRTAKACLTDPESKAAYDAALRGQAQPGWPTFPASTANPSPLAYLPQPASPLGGELPQVPQAHPLPSQPSQAWPSAVPTWDQSSETSAGSPAPSAMPVSAVGAPMGTPVEEAQPAFAYQGIASARNKGRQTASSKRSSVSVVLCLVMILILVVVAGLAFLSYQKRQRKNDAIARSQAAKTDEGAPPDEAANEVILREEVVKPSARKPVESPKPTVIDELAPTEKPSAGSEAKPQETPPKPEPEAAPDPQKQRALSEALANARRSLAEFDLEAARRFVETASRNAQNANEKAEAERLKMFAAHVEEFWKTMRQIVASLEATDEIPIGDDRVIVVEASPNHLIIKAQGGVREYSPLESMPYVLVTALADQRFAKDAASKAVYASYLTVAPQGDRQRARRLFEEAISEGLDVEYLLPELD